MQLVAGKVVVILNRATDLSSKLVWFALILNRLNFLKHNVQLRVAENEVQFTQHCHGVWTQCCAVRLFLLVYNLSRIMDLRNLTFLEVLLLDRLRFG